MSYRGLIFSGQKAKTIWYFPILYRVTYIDEKPTDQGYNYDTGYNLSNPPNEVGISPDWNTLVSQISQYYFHFALLKQT
jgi:hypothetical protein